jgi:DNA-binding NarL/FixJ family response regulator
VEAAAVSNKIHVLIADDHRLFAETLEALLATEDRVEVVGSARDGKEAVRLARKLRPDVILMDISMPVMDGFEATRRIRLDQQDACVLMLTGSNSRTDVDLARKAGAAGYVTKDRIAAELIDAILEVVKALGRCYPATRAPGRGRHPRHPLHGPRRPRPDALRPRHRPRRDGLHARLTGRHAHRRAQPYAADRGRRDPVLREHGPAVPSPEVAARLRRPAPSRSR